MEALFIHSLLVAIALFIRYGIYIYIVYSFSIGCSCCTDVKVMMVITFLDPATEVEKRCAHPSGLVMYLLSQSPHR